MHPNRLGTWKATALQGLPSLFERRDALAPGQAAHEPQVQDRYAQIGRLTTQVAWLQKKSGLDPDQK